MRQLVRPETAQKGGTWEGFQCQPDGYLPYNSYYVLVVISPIKLSWDNTSLSESLGKKVIMCFTFNEATELYSAFCLFVLSTLINKYSLGNTTFISGYSRVFSLKQSIWMKWVDYHLQ